MKLPWLAFAGLSACGPPDVWIDVAAGPGETCAVAASGRVGCWGIELSGVTIYDGPDTIVPHYATEAVNSVWMAPYTTVACGLTDGGHVACWGADFSGLSDAPDVAFSDLAISDSTACGIRADDGSLMCWGDGAPPVMPSGPVLDVAIGYAVCALDANGEDMCWDVIDQTWEPDPWPIPMVGPFVEIAGAWYPVVARRADGTLATTGTNIAEVLPPATQVSVGAAVCIVADDGSAYCADSDLQLPAGEYSKVSAGIYDVCGLHSDGSIVCVGDDDFGQVSNVDPFPDFRLHAR